MGIVKKVAHDLKESAKIQHQITKERHKDATKPPLQRQQEELERLKERNTSKR